MSSQKKVDPNETNICAVLSIVFAIIFAPVGIVLAFVAMSQIKKTKQKGKELAAAGLALSLVFMLVNFVIITALIMIGATSALAP